ncbi:EAL domain-containing protein [Vibrio diabolicus]|uniref:GGDEF domain-containing phosphodiesterase n=1 Tax=Vibrio diabolicus TaxID=50719 RepID=UPI00215F72B5|nr:GGDEF domain-containing phosphodiesterase [Vibrio diabolicus]MCS0385054.1 EAL domain-containing protein [Vibrio diabolicus]
MFHKLSLETKYICSTIFVVLFVVVINLALYMHGYDTYSNNLTRQITENSQEKTESYVKQKGLVYAELLSKQLFDPLYTDNISQAYEQIKATLSQPDVSKIHVVDNEGLIFHDGTTQLSMFAQPHYRSRFILKAIEESRILISFSKHQLEIAAPIQQSNITLGAVYLELNLAHLLEEKEQNIAQVQALTSNDKQKMFNLLLTISAISVLLGSAIAYALGRSLIKPLKQLKEQFTESNTQALPITDIKSKDEVGDLISAYNKMSNKVNRYTSRVEFMAYHDILTSLPNREKLLIDIQKQITNRKSPSLAVVFIDLDDFKHINDNYGHSIGDKLLGHIASELQGGLPSYFQPLYRLSTIVSRVGADEFVLVFPCKDSLHAREKADDIHRQLLSPFNLEENDIQITASLGVAVYPEFGSNAESLLQLSSLAAQESKRRGKDIMTIYDSAFDETVKQRLYIEKELRRSIRDLSQFELWYQPQFDLNTYQLIGVEALVRWNHPEKGYISPELFIPIAEQSDLILELGEYLIETAISQRAQWADHLAADFHIALNLSPRQIYRQDLSQLFSKYLQQYQVPPQTIHVEVTESLFIDDIEKAQYVLRKLQANGVEVWLDDFGTGYSALAYLQQMSFDGLKIDRSFIAQIQNNEQDDSLVRAIISMAHNLRMRVVAEGIETQTQLTRMESLHCDVVQGFFLGRPVPAEEIIEFEQQRQAIDDSTASNYA